MTACSSDSLDYNCPMRPPSSLSDVIPQQQRFLRKEKNIIKISERSDSDSLKDKEVGASLSGQYNNDGGNNAMWTRSLKYLKQENILDMDKQLDILVQKERGYCMITASMLVEQKPKPNNSTTSQITHYDIFSNVGDTVKSTFQQLYDSSCGLVSC